MKKITLLLCFMCFTIGNAQQFIDSGIKYNILSSTTVEVIANSPIYSGNITIPSVVNYNTQNYNVVKIGDNAFLNCYSLTNINIPNTIITIGNSAFNGCYGLTSIIIPNSVVNIFTAAFNSCIGLTSVIIPDSVNLILNNAFANCTNLNSISIPNSVTSIGVFAFFNCSSLNTVNCYITNPLTINANVFQNVNQSSCALNVPPGSVTAYQNAAVWQNFNPINGSLSSSTFSLNKSITLYPNPVKDILNIQLENNLEIAKIEILTLEGETIKTVKNTNRTSIDNLASGVYLVKIEDKEGKIGVQRFVKE